jgi:hypothetical protein
VCAACNPLMAQQHRRLEGPKPERDELEPAGQDGSLVDGRPAIGVTGLR